MRTFPALVLAVATCGCLTTACNTDNTYDVETSAECIVTGATLGTLPRTMHTLSSTGEDSTYTVNVSGSYYPLYIDQVENRIYNGDSLPVGTDVTRVTFQRFATVGTAAIRSFGFTLCAGLFAAFVLAPTVLKPSGPAGVKHLEVPRDD